MKQGWIVALGVSILLAGTPAVLAGPPGVTSGVVTSAYHGDQIAFHAFERGPTRDRCRAKGSVVYAAQRGPDLVVYQAVVKYASVDPDSGDAWFAGIVIDTTFNGEDSDLNVGRWMSFHVSDQGEGPSTDGLSFQWNDDWRVAKSGACQHHNLNPGALIAGDVSVQLHPLGQRQ